MHDVNQWYEALCQRRDTLQAELVTLQLTETAIQDAI